jgi:hypothetical protein
MRKYSQHKTYFQIFGNFGPKIKTPLRISVSVKSTLNLVCTDDLEKTIQFVAFTLPIPKTLEN